MIREAEACDGPAVRRLLEELGYPIWSESEMNSRLETVLGLPDERVLAVDDAGTVIGLVHFRISRTLTSG